MAGQAVASRQAWNRMTAKRLIRWKVPYQMEIDNEPGRRIRLLTPIGLNNIRSRSIVNQQPQFQQQFQQQSQFQQQF